MFDVGDVVKLLKEDNAVDVCVIQVPKELKYVDYMVIATGKSTRQLKAMAEYIKKIVRNRGRKYVCILAIFFTCRF